MIPRPEERQPGIDFRMKKTKLTSSIKQALTRASFDLTDLQLLVNVAEQQSLTKGAERSHLSLSAASLRIKAFEQNLGIKVLYRTKQGATLTPPGRTLLHHSRVVLRQLENLRGDLQEYASGLKGHVRLFANATSISSSLPSVLRRYLSIYPSVDVELRERLSDDSVRAIMDGIADVAIVAGNTPAEGLELVPYGTERLVLVTAAEHPLAARKRVAFEETVGFNYVGLEEGSALSRFLSNQAHGLNKKLNFRIQVGSFEAICRMVEADIGVGIVPESAARRYAEVMPIGIVWLSDAWSARDSMICVRSLNSLPVFAQKLVAMLADTGGPAESSARRHPSK
jgi:DNA-binding transcriptional LysR family regulator